MCYLTVAKRLLGSEILEVSSSRARSEVRRVTQAMRGEDKILELIASIYEAAV